MSVRDLALEVTLRREAEAELKAALDRKDRDAEHYARTSLALIRGSEHARDDADRNRMIGAAGVCLESARVLLWGDEEVKVSDVS